MTLMRAPYQHSCSVGHARSSTVFGAFSMHFK
jgi:hypothetical protein